MSLSAIISVLCFVSSAIAFLLVLKARSLMRVALLGWISGSLGLLAAANAAMLAHEVWLAELDLQLLRHMLSIAALVVLVTGVVRQLSNVWRGAEPWTD